MPLSDEEQVELLDKVRELHAAFEAGLVVTLTTAERAAIGSTLRNTFQNMEMNVPIPAGVATFTPKSNRGT